MQEVSARWNVFVHQDGVLLCTTLRALSQVGMLEPSLVAPRTVTNLFPQITPSGFGYLRVALRCLASQGLLADTPTLDPETTEMRWTAVGRTVARYFPRYVAAGELLATFTSNDSLAWSRSWTRSQRAAFLDLLPLACERWRLRGGDLAPQVAALVTTHLDSGLVVPMMLHLLTTGALTEAGPRLGGDDGDHAGFRRLLHALGWINWDGTWTPDGHVAARAAVHFGMAVSYLPLLADLPELFRGRRVVLTACDNAEWHVHRGLNVSASAAAHARYFADADAMFLEIFNREPVEDQPRFVADMGCGDGSWLVHLHDLVMTRSLRGQRRQSHPLLMVGIDYNEAARDHARAVLAAQTVPALVVAGDISDPDALRATLAGLGLTIEDGLHIRAFIDHNRTYVGGDRAANVRGWSSGAYVDPGGAALHAADVERDLVSHLRRWVPHVRRHGLVMLEAHCVDPRIACQHLGATHAVAFDAYHGYSHQYPIEYSAFVHCCQQAGLQPLSHHERQYPASRPFVAVSLNRFVVPDQEASLPAMRAAAVRHDTWVPASDDDLHDGRALHELLYVAGDVRHPRLWCSAPTGHVVAGALAQLEHRIASARSGDVVRVLDYGAGTGFAALELLKACRERAIDRQIARAGATLEMHLVDLPSSWFAQGFELLRHCGWTRFHSLRADGGGFRPLAEVVGRGTIDVAVANMVFHLVPPAALWRVAADLASVMVPGGRLFWNSPDLGPAGPYSVLFHDANRALRARWLELLATAAATGSGPVDEAVRRACARLDQSDMRIAQNRADRQVLPRANAAVDVERALAVHFSGELVYRTYEILEQDVVDTLLVPANQAEFLSEIDDRQLREAVIRELMVGEVLPAMRAKPGGTAVGLNVQWSLGSYTLGTTPNLA